MTESQHTEYKERWRDEYFQWICGCANAQGGRLLIGVDDHGGVCGISNARELLEKLPNQVRQLMGILVDVNLLEEDTREYLEIVVEPYPYPISYKGKYYYRSGSTRQELKGAALDRFLLKKQGKRWDGVPVPNVRVEDLSDASFDYFRAQALKSKRVSEDVLRESNAALIDKPAANTGCLIRYCVMTIRASGWSLWVNIWEKLPGKLPGKLPRRSSLF